MDTATVSTAAGEASDVELVRAAQTGDREAFGQLYQRYARRTARFISSKLGRRADRYTIDDLTSETFLAAWRLVSKLEIDDDCDTQVWHWLRGIAEYRFLNYRRWIRRHPHERGDALSAEPDEHASPAETGKYETGPYGGCDPETLVLASIDRDVIAHAIHAVLATLSLPQRRCVQLRYFEHRTVADTARAMNRDPIAVESLHRRATHNLAAALDPDGQPRQPGRYQIVRARITHTRQARQPARSAGRGERHPGPGDEASACVTPASRERRVALAACASKAELLHTAWRFLGMTSAPDTADMTAAINWLSAHGYHVSLTTAYTARRQLTTGKISTVAEGVQTALGGVTGFPAAKAA